MTEMPRKNAFVRPDVPSLASVRERIASDYSIETQRRRDLVSALETMAEWISLPLDLIPAEVSFIRKASDSLHPSRLGVSERRIQNVRSLIKAAFRMVGVSTKLPPRTTSYSADYQKLWDMLGGDKYAKTSLSSFLRYCSALGIALDAITDEVSEAYRLALETESMIKDPRTHHQVACKVWNAKAKQHRDKGWPKITLTVPRYDTRLYAIDDDMIPDGIKKDIDAYIAHLEGRDLFNSIAVPLKPTSIRSIKGHIRRYLSGLYLSGVDLKSLNSLDEAVTPEMFKLAMQWHFDRNGNKSSKHISEIAWTIRCYAVKYRATDEATATFFANATTKLRVQHEGLSPKNLKAMTQFDEKASVIRYVRAPMTLWSKAETLKDTSSHQALLMVQAAIAIEILMFAPMRLHNLTSLRLDTHINRINDRIHLHIDAKDVKNNVTLDFVLSEATSKRIDRYIKEWRPLARCDNNPYLFPGRNQKPKDESALRDQISTKLFLVTGLTLTPHQFRHTAAKLFLDMNPGQYEVIRKVLGHKALSTTYSHYAGAETKAALAHFDDAIVNLINGPQAVPPSTTPIPQPKKQGSPKSSTSRFTSLPFVEPPLSPPKSKKRAS